MKITVAHSPDSDDAFMFYGLASGAVSVDEFDVEQVLADIETLNRAAFDGTYEVTAVSFHAYAHLIDRYALLPHGASMGDRYGPVLVTRQDGPTGLDGVTVAIPGTLTTAYLALQLYHPGVAFEVVPFDEIQPAVHAGKVEAGLLIHEGQLTYAEEGLRPIVDLGVWWAERTGGLPLPLGCNVIRRDLGAGTMQRVSRMLHDSIAYALEHRADAVEYALQYGRGLDEAKTDRFVGMYVNDLTLDYGERGRAAVERLFTEAYEKKLIPSPVPVEFVSSLDGGCAPEPPAVASRGPQLPHSAPARRAVRALTARCVRCSDLGFAPEPPAGIIRGALPRTPAPPSPGPRRAAPGFAGHAVHGLTQSGHAPLRSREARGARLGRAMSYARPARIPGFAPEPPAGQLQRGAVPPHPRSALAGALARLRAARRRSVPRLAAGVATA